MCVSMESSCIVLRQGECDGGAKEPGPEEDG